MVGDSIGRAEREGGPRPGRSRTIGLAVVHAFVLRAERATRVLGPRPLRARHRSDLLLAFCAAQNSEDASALLSDEFAKEVAEQFHGFKVNLNAGKTTILLRRKVKDMHVEVELEACNTEVLGEREPEADAEGAGAEDEPEDNNVYAYTASVTVDREGSDSRVIFLVVVPLEEEAGVEINTVYNVPKGMTIDQADKEGRYTPPSFSELDVGVQSSFHLFLAELGIDDKFADAVRVVADRKEQSEYIKWLKSLHSFVGGKMISA